eukprot:COSAG06_NODE_841_length_11989_cov_4.537763_6_plen_66_part_00
MVKSRSSVAVDDQVAAGAPNAPGTTRTAHAARRGAMSTTQLSLPPRDLRQPPGSTCNVTIPKHGG